ncbi:MAG: hypothetical protein AAFX44_08610 [Pseudomonadota bacterium]
MSFFSELNRRNVVRVAAAYVVLGWLLLQVADTLSPLIGLPDTVSKVLFVLLLIGFVPTAVFAWAFELTPDGIKREKTVQRDAAMAQRTARRLDIVTIAAAILVGVLFTWQQLAPRTAGVGSTTIKAPTADGNSIAVLAFADMSERGDQTYFADGVAEQIQHVLSDVPDLRVAGRTSSFSFRGKAVEVREISATLGVAHILEGSVRRAGDRLRITATLIRGSDGIQIWSETYDRTAADVFDIQDEIARSVAEQLAGTLGLDTDSLLTVERTDDLDAYDNYLRAQQLFALRGKENLDRALLLLQEAAAKDPNYAPTWATIALIYGVYEVYAPGFPLELGPYEQWRRIGRAAAERAIELDPGNALAHGTLGVFLDYERDLVNAYVHFDRAVELAPRDPRVLDLASQHLQEAGYFDEALDLSLRAVRLDPLRAIYHNTLTTAYGLLGDHPRAIEYSEKTIELDPALQFAYTNLAISHYALERPDAAVDTTEQAVAAGHFPEEAKGFAVRVSDSWDDEAALRAMLGDHDYADAVIALALGDREIAVARAEAVWRDDYQKELGVMRDYTLPLLVDDERWKAQVKKVGLLALWRERGFPAQCQPVGDDDFTCTAARPSSHIGNDRD